MTESLSLLRRLQYRELAKIPFYGSVLDLGGSRQADYLKLIHGASSIKSANLSDNLEIDYRFDFEMPFPLENNLFEGIVCLNVLEHIYNYRNVIKESFRILKEGGQLAGAVPFLYPVHLSPSDYHRYTKFALERVFKEAGFKEIKIKELGGGVFSVLYQLKFGLFHFNFVRKIMLAIYPLFDKLITLIKPESFLSSKYMPLGYFFVAKK